MHYKLLFIVKVDSIDRSTAIRTLKRNESQEQKSRPVWPTERGEEYYEPWKELSTKEEGDFSKQTLYDILEGPLGLRGIIGIYDFTFQQKN